MVYEWIKYFWDKSVWNELNEKYSDKELWWKMKIDSMNSNESDEEYNNEK